MYTIIISKSENKLMTIHLCIEGCKLGFSPVLYNIFEGSEDEIYNYLIDTNVIITEQDNDNYKEMLDDIL